PPGQPPSWISQDHSCHRGSGLTFAKAPLAGPKQAQIQGCWARAVLDGAVPPQTALHRQRAGCTLLALGIMDFEALRSVEGGSVTLLEFQWPWPPEPDADGDPLTCICYVVMKRPEGFVLCLPLGFLPEGLVLAGQLNEEATGLGPSLEVVAQAVRLGSQGEWTAAELGESVGALAIDLPASASAALSVPDLTAFGGIPFLLEDPGLFPLASDVLAQTQEWAAEALGAQRSGYQTAVEEPAPRRPKGPRAKRHTVASLAEDQANLQALVRGLASQLSTLLPAAAGSNSLAQGPAADYPPGLGPEQVLPKQAQASRLEAPLSAVLPPAQHVPKALAQVIGPPPPARQAPKRASPMVDLEAQLADTIGGGDGAPEAPSALASAVLAQSQALVSLVAQLAQNSGEPLLDAPSATSVRGAAGRQKLQQELQSAPGSFSKKIRENACRRMDPSGLVTPDCPTMVRYLERYGSFAKQKNLALVAWMTALAGDQLARGASEAASDTIALLQLVVDQACLDGGDFTFAWVLGLQPDLPTGVFQDVAGSVGPATRAFSPLAEQRWVTVALSYLKEIEAITTRRAELHPPRRPGPPNLPQPTDPPKAPPKTPDPEGLSKKQARAAAWAAKRAAASKLVLKSGTAFGHFLKTTLPLCRDSSLGAATALFPLPLPHDGLFVKRSRRRSLRRRLPHLVRVALHVLVMSLNFLHADGKHIPPDCLRRPPSELQATALSRLTELIKACARLGGTTLQAGRRGLQLAARHAEVLHHLRAAGLEVDSYFGKSPPAAVVPEFSEALVPHLPGGPEELSPYRDLDAERIVLSGTGSWPLAEHLGPDLLMLYLEPRAMRSFVPSVAPGPSFEHECKRQVLSLFIKWDSLGLLGLTPGPLPTTSLTRIFGAFKDSGKDRQIGDRRNMNNQEACISNGPSSRRPSGSLLTRLVCPRGTHALFGSIVDRRDFYHQALVSESRAQSNAIGPVFSLRDFYGTQALTDYLAQADAEVRQASGALSVFRPSSVLAASPCKLHGTFKSLLQGDHAGVEFACAGHEGLLRSWGVLGDPPQGRLLNRCPVSCSGPWSGLIIDDLFCLSCENAPELLAGASDAEAQSEKLLRRAKAAYTAEGVPGSDHKDQFGQRVCTVAGAQVAESNAAGLTLVGLPAARRLALSQASLIVASSRWISEELASILAGSWVTALLYRPHDLGRCPRCKARPGVASLVTNVSAPFSPVVSCSDASTARGATCKAPLPPVLSAHLWQSADQKGWYTKLSEDGPEMFEELPACPVARPVACRYDFLEVRCGGPWLSALLCDRLCVGPVVDFTVSPFFSLCDPRCLEWIHFMLQEGRLKSLLVVPPVGSFSPAWKPRIRAWDPPILRHPCPRARREDAILGAAISTLLVATRCNALAMVLRPLQSFARGSAPWRHLCIHRGAVEATLCACDAFSAGRQAAVVLVAAPGARALAPQISDITVESGSSSSERLAAVLAGLVRARPPAPAPTKGLESLLFNDVMLTARWRVSRSWPWRDRAHINVLEVRAFLCELKDRAACGDDARFVHGLDSYVALGALTKGRTSSLRLLPLVKQSAAIQAAFGQYPALHFCPTRLNASDDPTRGVDLRSPVPASIASGLPASCLYEASCQSEGKERCQPWGRQACPRPNFAQNRQKLLVAFGTWLAGFGTSLEVLLAAKPLDPEVIASWLVSYGRQLYEAGRPYWHYSETINGVAAMKPSLRRSLQGAWDLAFSWMAKEPNTHHLAMPPVILLSMLCTCLYWGWLREAGIFALSWGGLLRIGEATSARRSDLILPADVLHLQRHALIRIEEPKTRMRMARHQSAKVEQSDLVELLHLAFADLESTSRLWPQSPQTLRRRFDLVLERIGLPTARTGQKQLDLGSFRPGGATFILSQTEDSELVRRRGRWASQRVMEIYIQEVQATVYFPSLPAELRLRIMNLAQCFSSVLAQAVAWKRVGVPPSSWFAMFSAGERPSTGL
ncbi:unnamed protein product, partial [Symbiodinium microadriaticum]